MPTDGIEHADRWPDVSPAGSSLAAASEASGTEAGRRVARNSAWNFLGTLSPMLVAVVAVPALVHRIGTERFGLLATAWMILGYAAFVDVGLRSAIVRLVAQDVEHGRVAEARSLVWTALLLNGLLGLFGTAMVVGLAPWLVNGVLNIPAELRTEASGALIVVALAIPVAMIGATARAALEGQHRFGLLNVLQGPASALVQGAPLAVLPFSRDVRWMVAAMVAARLLGDVATCAAAARPWTTSAGRPGIARRRLGGVFSYGGWLTISNVVGAVMVYADRFVIGTVASMSAVTYYSICYEAITRLWIFPHSVTRTIFPMLSARADGRQRADVCATTAMYLALVLAPVVATVIVFAPDLLRLWLGEPFVEPATRILQILAFGVLLNSLAMVPFTLIQASGRPDVTAKLHLAELPLYLLLLWHGVWYWGATGAAIAWTVRVGGDGVLLAAYARRISRFTGDAAAGVPRALALAVALNAGAWLVYTCAADVTTKTLAWGVVLGVATYGAWRFVLRSDWRERARMRFRAIGLPREPKRGPCVRKEGHGPH